MTAPVATQAGPSASFPLPPAVSRRWCPEAATESGEQTRMAVLSFSSRRRQRPNGFRTSRQDPSVGGFGRFLPGGVEQERTLAAGRSPMVGDLSGADVSAQRPEPAAAVPGEPRSLRVSYSGNDPVLTVDENRRESGQTDHCVIYDGRLYMFASAATVARFKQDPRRYAAGGRQ